MEISGISCSFCHGEVINKQTGDMVPCNCEMAKAVGNCFTAQIPVKEKTDLKDYSSKLPMSEMQWKAFTSDRGVAGVFKFAMKKYGNVSSWRNRTPESLERYESAMLRHYAKWKNGEAIDPESGLNHWAAIACNAMTMLEFIVEDENAKGTN